LTPRKDIEQVVRAAWRQGWRVEKTKGGHWKLYSPNGLDIVIASGTPRSHRSVEETIAELRRNGFVWKGR
jgi:predicted RNA binding protein YcfA (HicA-like mRNA interferase family)